VGETFSRLSFRGAWWGRTFFRDTPVISGRGVFLSGLFSRIAFLWDNLPLRYKVFTTSVLLLGAPLFSGTLFLFRSGDPFFAVDRQPCFFGLAAFAPFPPCLSSHFFWPPGRFPSKPGLPIGFFRWRLFLPGQIRPFLSVFPHTLLYIF